MSQEPDTKSLDRDAVARGRVHGVEELSMLFDHDPEFFGAYDQAVRTGLLREGAPVGDAALPMRYRELIVSAMLTLRSVTDQALANHLVRALDDGLTHEEAMEGFMAAYVVGGSPTLVKALRCLRMAQATVAERSGS